MAIIKCKMCGGDMELSADNSIGTCEYCGSTMTIPKLDDDQRAAAFDRGNHFRRIGEFDKALSVYERIVQEDDTDAEAHWCCALCRFGIEYVKDPNSGKYIPICHRASFNSFLEDVDYQAALTHADVVAKSHYQAAGERIAALQRDILSTSQKEEPFDVFLCYKETDDQGQRTVDSTLAQEIYYQLTEQGRRVFFARITLEDKPGQEYEPYIFSALQSAKVMVVVGTKPEYLNAVWVKNEWSRYLALVKQDRKRLLIPCYRDMDPYDMPEQLSVLQSYDISKIGFIQDLTRGINKVLDADKTPQPATQETVVVQGEGGNLQALLKRGSMALEDGEWTKADDFFEQVLNLDAECGEAYFGKLLAVLNCSNMEAFYKRQTRWQPEVRHLQPYEEDRRRREAEAIRKYQLEEYLPPKRIAALFNFTKTVPSKVASYQKALEEAEAFWTQKAKLAIRALRFAQGEFAEQLAQVRDAISEHFHQMVERAKEEERANADAVMAEYAKAMERAEEVVAQCHEDAKRQKAAVEKQRVLDEAEALKQQAKNRRNAIVGSIIFVICIAALLYWSTVIVPRNRYQEAQELLAAGDLDSAISTFLELGDYKDAADRALATKYQKAEGLLAAKELDGAISIFLELGDYKDAADRSSEARYQKAERLLANGEKAAAAMEFFRVGQYRDAHERSFALWEEITQRDTIAFGGKHIVAVKNDGTVAAEGSNEYEQCEVSDWTDVVAVSAGKNYTVALKADGTVVNTDIRKIERCDTSEWTDMVAVAAGDYHIVGLKADGTVVATGSRSGERGYASEWTDVVAVAAGSYYTVALKADGTVVAVGPTGYNRCDVSDWTDIVAIATGEKHIVGLKRDGTVVMEGCDEYGEQDVSDWTDVVAVAAGINGNTVALRADGTVLATGGDRDWTDIVAISIGNTAIIGLKADGSMVTFEYYNIWYDIPDWTDIKVPERH